MLEVLKNFLDCENCVFVLAIDYQVVSLGVRKKYGNEMDEEKGKAFFEKIIQLPFKVPVYQYDLYKFVNKSLREVGFSRHIDVNKCLQLIQRSIGKNPRAIKRLFNSALLLMKVNRSKNENKKSSKEDELILFAILCMQLSFEEAYNFLVENIGDITNAEELLKYTDIDYYTEIVDKSSIQDDIGISDDEVLRLI